MSTTEERRAMADGGEEVVPAGFNKDALKKIAEEEIKKMEKLQLIPYPYMPPRYRYSKEKDTELTMADKEKMN
jgi:hypothetical protein